MKFNKNRGGGRGGKGGRNSSSAGTRKKIITNVEGRKQLRKQKRQQKKQNRASFHDARSNNRKNKSCLRNENGVSGNSSNPQTNNSNKIKQLQAFVEAEKLKLRNGKGEAFKFNKDKDKGKKKKKVTFQNCPSDSPSDEEESTGGFQHTSTSGNNSRLARLQEFVNREAGKMQGKNSNSKKSKNLDVDPKDDGVKDKPNLIKDKGRLLALRSDQESDTKEINRLARLLRFRRPHQKKKVGSLFAQDYESLLQDIEAGTLTNSEKYKTDEAATLHDSEDELEKDMALALGQEPKEKKDNDKKLTQKQQDDDGGDDVDGDSMGKDFDEFENGSVSEEDDGESDEEYEYGEIEDEERNEYGENEDEEIVDEGENDLEEDGITYDDDDDDDSEQDHEDDDEQASKSVLKKRKYLVMRQNGYKDNEEEENGNDTDDSEQDHENERVTEPPPKKRKYLIKQNCYEEVEGEENEGEEDEEEESGEEGEEDEEDGEKNNEAQEEEEESEDEDGFLDSQAEEDDSMEESEDDGRELVHDIRKEEEYAFEGGSGYYSKPEVLKNGQENDIDRYSSNSEDDEDLEGFVVDDDEVEYENVSDGLPSDELSASPSPVRKKRRRLRIKSDDSDEDDKVTKNNKETNDHVALDDDDDDDDVDEDGRLNCLNDTNDEVSSEVTSTEYGEFSACEDESEEEPPAASNMSDEKEMETELKEDIYGRLRDKDGNIVSSKREETPVGGRYVPPALRKLMALNMDEKKKEQLANVKKSLKGLLNRLAESNLGGIISQIEAMYLKYSRNDMNETLTALLMESLVGPTLTPERLMQEHALLVAILSTNVGNEVGAHILNEFVLKWNDDVSEVKEVESKELDNLLLFIANLYNFRVMQSKLLYDILDKLAHGFCGKEVELILLVLRSVGFTLRKDDPLALKSLITRVQSKATEVQGSEDRGSEFSRVHFMLEVVQAIRNNNMTKVPNYDPSHSEHLKKILKGFLHKGTQLTPLNISLEDLLKSRECGRWWIVGSAWSGGPLPGEKPPQENRNPAQHKALETEFSEKFKKRAAKLHLSRPPRINILYTITEGSEDYLDAFEKILHLSLPAGQEQDIFSVILLCCQKGKVYNPFFAHLTNRMCNFDKKYQKLLELALWDKFQEIESHKPREVANLAKYLTYLIGEDSLNLHILKQISFMDAESQMISFLRQILIGLLLHPSGSDTVQRVFSRLSSSPKFLVLRQSLRIFILKFLKSKKNAERSDHAMLSKRIQEVTEILSRGGGISL